MLRYTTFQYYFETNFSKFFTPVILEHLWGLHFGTKIVCLENGFFDLDKTWR